MPTVGEGQRPDGDGVGPRRRSNRFFLIAAASIASIAVLVVVLTAPGGNSRAAYEQCRDDVQPVFAAMQNLGSHLDVGMVESDYTSEVGDLQSAYDRLSAKRPALACEPVARALGEAMHAYAQASSAWNECIFDEEEECGEGAVQELWATADREIATAKKRLHSLTGGSDAVVAAESEAAQVVADARAREQAHSAQVAIETYAVDHNGSYVGATPAELRKIEPSLSPSIEVVEAGTEYYSITVDSKGGNWFEIDREIDGTVDFKCGQPGRAGCPATGTWG